MQEKIKEVLNYHGYIVSDACVDAIVQVFLDTTNDMQEGFDSWGNPIDGYVSDVSDTGDFFDSWGYRSNSRRRSSWE